ncbi:hypothetical protein V8C35DRAFT_306395, partial [Trichoderma chlorosporum]
MHVHIPPVYMRFVPTIYLGTLLSLVFSRTRTTTETSQSNRHSTSSCFYREIEHRHVPCLLDVSMGHPRVSPHLR